MVRCGQSFGVFDVQLFLTSFGFAFGSFDRYTHCPQMIADWAHDWFFFGRLEDVVVFVVIRNRLQFETVARDVVMRALEQEEFKLCCHNGRKTHRLGTRDLLFKDLARCMWDGRMGMVIQHIT